MDLEMFGLRKLEVRKSMDLKGCVFLYLDYNFEEFFNLVDG